MSLIARIQFVNFLTYSNPDSRDRKPALRVVEFWPLKYSAAINIPNGHGKTNMITALFYLLSRDRKLKDLALSLFTPRRCGTPSHIRVQLWDLPDELAQRDLTFDEGLLDPRDIPNRNDQYVFGLCAYQGEEPRFYYYRGTLEDCDVYRRTDNSYVYHQESEVQQTIKQIGGTWNISSAAEWRSLVTSHIPSRVLAQQVKFHLAGGGDKSAPLQHVEPEEDESFDQAFFLTVIAPEVLASTGEFESDPADPRENFEDELYAHFSKMASAALRAEQEKRAIEQQEEAVRELGTLVAAGERAQQSHAAFKNAVASVARDVAAIRHVVRTDPFPGLLDGRRQPVGKAAELLPYLVIDRHHGVIVLDIGIARLLGTETREVNQAAFRGRCSSLEVDPLQVIDFACDIKIFGVPGWGGTRVEHKAYALDAALVLVQLLGAAGTPRASAAAETLRQTFAWAESTADTNAYRKEAREVEREIGRLQGDVRQRDDEILHSEAEARELNEKITKYDQAKGAFEDLVRSGAFTGPELAMPSVLGEQVAHELQTAEAGLATHDKRVGSLEQIYARHGSFIEAHPGISARGLHANLSAAQQATSQACEDAERCVQQSKEEVSLVSSQSGVLEHQRRVSQQQLGVLQELQSYQSTYRTWFGNVDPGTIDIAAGLERIRGEENALAQRHRTSLSLHDAIAAVLPAVPRYHELFPGMEAESLDIPGQLVKIAGEEHALAKRRATSHALLQRLIGLAPFVERFHGLFGHADPHALDPAKERADLQNSITLMQSASERLEQEVSTLMAFRARHPGARPAAWLVDMEAHRTSLTRDLIHCQQQVRSAARQLNELKTDPVSRPESVAFAHTLIADKVPFVLLHEFIAEYCPPKFKQHWLTHFSALLFSPVVQTLDDAATAARFLYEGQAMMPVLIAERLQAAMESGAPVLALDGECAYTWLAGVKTRMVHCLLNPAAVEEERRLAEARLDEAENALATLQQALDELSEQSEEVVLARGAARAETSDAESELLATRADLATLHERFPDVVRRSAPDALESIAKAREEQQLRREHGADIKERVVAELEQIDLEASQLRTARAWHETRNTDDVRGVITAMRRYQTLLRTHGDDVQQRTDEELRRIADAKDVLQRERKWHEERNTDDTRIAVSAMRRFLAAGGDKEVDRLGQAVEDASIELEVVLARIREATGALSRHEAALSKARTDAQAAASAYHQNERYLGELACFGESDDLLFMESHLAQRTELANGRRSAETRKSYESQFIHAQRYIDQRDSNVGEEALLTRKAAAEAKATLAKEKRASAIAAIDEKNKRQTSLERFRDALHDAACRLLVEFRAVTAIMDDTGLSVNEDTPRFENTDLYQSVEEIRIQLDRTEDSPFLLEHIRKVGRCASELGLAGQAKEISRAKRDSERLATYYAQSKMQLCKDILDGKRKGLSVLNAEWLRDQEHFDAPTVLRGQIEADIAGKRDVLTQAAASLEDIREKTTSVLTMLVQDARRALAILEETMNTTPAARFYVAADIISPDSINALLDRLYEAVEARRKAHLDTPTATQKRHKKSDLDYLRNEIYRSLFANVSVEFRHPSIWQGEKSRLKAKGLSEGMRTAISLMWVAKLAEFRLLQAIDQSGGMRRQNRAALRKERYFVILDGLFSSLSHDDMIDSAMESLRTSAGHFQLIGMIHHPRYINNPKIFPAYFVGRPFRATNGKHAWLTVDKQKDVQASLGVFSSHYTP